MATTANVMRIPIFQPTCLTMTKPIPLAGNDGKTVGQTYAQELIQNDMLKWIRKNAQQPFFLFYAVTLPHGRHEIDDIGQYADKPWSLTQKSYAAQITRLDSDMGEMVDLLRELKIDDDTLVIFTGDNGSSFSPESDMGNLFKQANNGLRGYKRGLYEGALRQAALAWWPGQVPAGRVDDQPWAFWDVMPTFVELSGAEVPRRIRNRRQVGRQLLEGRRRTKTRLFLLGASRRETDPGGQVWRLESSPKRHSTSRSSCTTWRRTLARVTILPPSTQIESNKPKKFSRGHTAPIPTGP